MNPIRRRDRAVDDTTRIRDFLRRAAYCAWALQMLLDKYFPRLRPDRDYRPTTPQDLARTRVYRIDIERWSGKQNHKPANFPGAFHHGGRG